MTQGEETMRMRRMTVLVLVLAGLLVAAVCLGSAEGRHALGRTVYNQFFESDVNPRAELTKVNEVKTGIIAQADEPFDLKITWWDRNDHQLMTPEGAKTIFFCSDPSIIKIEGTRAVPQKSGQCWLSVVVTWTPDWTEGQQLSWRDLMRVEVQP